MSALALVFALGIYVIGTLLLLIALLRAGNSALDD